MLLGPRAPPPAGSPRQGSGSEAVREAEQIRQTQHPATGSRQGDVQTLGPAGGNRVQSVVRAGETAGDRGDGFRVTAEVDRGADRVLVTGRRAQGPDGGAQARPDGSVELGGPVGVPARGEDGGVSLTVVRGAWSRTRGRAPRGSAPSSATRTSSWKTAVPSQAARSPWVRAAMRRAASIVACCPSRAQWAAEVAARIEEPLPAACWSTWKWTAAAMSQGMLPVSTPSVCRPMSLGSDAAQFWKREEVRQVQAVLFRQRLRHQDGRLRVVRGLAGLPAAASAHLVVGTVRREPRGERPGGAELEGAARRVTHRRADDPLHPFHAVGLSARWRRPYGTAREAPEPVRGRAGPPVSCGAGGKAAGRGLRKLARAYRHAVGVMSVYGVIFRTLKGRSHEA
ncbi:hypothetical protein GCM10010446_51480 [Streptomyces enissocaesilis]|uniref:Uncharacterized protein n=1 Tax=Streptomyces enissocaesilis TaxID=332589 RepID=A0ABP6K126_9ACTN